jgi:hypothetical protein
MIETENMFDHFTSVSFHRYKGFQQYSVSLQHFNILVGPNNCGKSTILGVFRILAEGMRKARSKRPETVAGPDGDTLGYPIDLSDMPISTENVFYDYDDSEPAIVEFNLSNRNKLILFFPEVGLCSLICQPKDRYIYSTSQFKKEYNSPIGFVPVLGPVEHNEQLYQKDAARLALLTHRASRNFRNIWYHYPEEFDKFRDLVRTTWHGMDIENPQIDQTHSPCRLHMFCPEERIPREIFWAGFGFQVWCQMLTYILRGRNSSIFLIDEPDIYLHSDLQRQLLGILRALGPDILIATHSTELISEAEPDNILVVNKRWKTAKRIKHPDELQQVFEVLGSNLNPVLTQLAKTKKALFVEGKDFQLVSRFARKLGFDNVANRSEFAVVPAEGFNINKVRDFTKGIETTLGFKIRSAIIFDRDYRSDKECDEIKKSLEDHCVFVHIHQRKEIENFLLHPLVLNRAIQNRLTEYNKRTNKNIEFNEVVLDILNQITDKIRNRIAAQYLEKRKPFEKNKNPNFAAETITENLMSEFDQIWDSQNERFKIVPGKEILSDLNVYLQQNYSISISKTLIVDSFKKEEIECEMIELLELIDKFEKNGKDQ